MNKTLHSFISVFKDGIKDSDGEIKRISRIVIPAIQRDYAQGRDSKHVNRIRERFLSALRNALVKEPITLDFVYGDINEHSEWILLDGQQRLTTLFLLHWYAAKKEKVSEKDYCLLRNFSYEIRHSTRDFCSKLVEFNPTFEKDISEEIKDQEWYSSEWGKDPSISAMLVTLSDIQKEFEDVANIWDGLTNDKIMFHCIAIKNYGLADDIYIRMNSRGKPLTTFEHFKAEFESLLKNSDLETKNRIMSKIDKEWTDVLWVYKDSDNLVDEGFLNYFKFVCDIICYKDNGSTIDRTYDVFDLLDIYFRDNNENIEFLEKCFDCWVGIDIEGFFSKYISKCHEHNKIKYNNMINIFEDCVKNYSDENGRSNKFRLNRIPLFYSIVYYLMNKDEKEIEEDQFIRRLRIINNLINNSEDDISEGLNRAKGNQMQQIIEQVESLMGKGKFKEGHTKSFNNNQITEEKEKDEWLKKNPNLAEDLFALEDNELLYGQIAILGLDNNKLWKKFAILFDNYDKSKIDRALMTIGFYGQQEQNGWRYQLGSENNSSWHNLFHRSSNKGFENTKSILVQLLNRDDDWDDGFLDRIITNYIEECEKKNEFDVRYYYVKYDSFRPQAYGKFDWKPLDEPYDILLMQTKTATSKNSFKPFLCEADDTKEAISKEYAGKRLVIGDKYVECDNHSYIIKSSLDENEKTIISINCNEKGIDTEDRIVKLKKELKNLK